MSEQAWSSSLNMRLKEEHVSNLNKEISSLESELESKQKIIDLQAEIIKNFEYITADKYKKELAPLKKELKELQSE